MKKFGLIHYCLLSAGLFSGSGLASEPYQVIDQRDDVLNMPENASAFAKAAVRLPVNGMSKATVEKRFGTPLNKEAAVGDPPISVWHYPNFKVFFEYQLVLHSVSDIRKPVVYPPSEQPR